MAQTFEALDSTEREAARPLGLGFLALAAVTYVLVVLGALVRAHGAGLACPDWPLCFGEVIPRFDFEIAFEWGHRALAGTVGLVFVGLAALVLRHPSLRRSMQVGLLLAATLLAVQIVLGGLTVLQLLASWTVTSHLVTGNAFALSLVLLGRRLLAFGSDAPAMRRPAEPWTRAIVTVAGVLLATQIVLGGLVSSSYAGLACPDWPTCIDGEFFPTWTGLRGLHVLHRMVGYGVVLVILAAAGLAREHAGSRRWLGAAAGLAVLQVLVGVANVSMRIPVEITGLHSALAAALVCTVGVGVREVWRGAGRSVG
ncbi:MAG TPA: COX15/CtaA family protein [Myxococcota bacterium]|nr:COX15/CtaA family protein [Myxococcota bacterium]